MTMKPYGVAIYDAVERGDEPRLRRLLSTAQTLHDQQGDLGKAIRDGNAALKKIGSSKSGGAKASSKSRSSKKK